MIQQAIALSLREIDHGPVKEVMLSSCLNVDCPVFMPTKKGGKKRS